MDWQFHSIAYQNGDGGSKILVVWFSRGFINLACVGEVTLRSVRLADLFFLSPNSPIAFEVSPSSVVKVSFETEEGLFEEVVDPSTIDDE
jgi:hypothetical protein